MAHIPTKSSCTDLTSSRICRTGYAASGWLAGFLAARLLWRRLHQVLELEGHQIQLLKSHLSQKSSRLTASGTSLSNWLRSIGLAARRLAAAAVVITVESVSSRLACQASNSGLLAGTMNVASTRCRASSSFCWLEGSENGS